jgi:hypothetical protein
MLRRLIATAVAAVSLAAFHASVAAAPPVFIECHTPAVTIPVMILIENQGNGKVRDAVHHCVFFWGGRPSGTVR